MNQILDHSGPKKKKGYEKSVNFNDIRKIIKIFSIVILIFGIALIGNGSYGLYKNGKKSKSEVISEPLISVTENDGKLTINVTHDKAIEKVLYNWDDEEATEVKGKGENFLNVENIGLMEDEHILYVTAIDSNGVQSNFEKSYYSEESNDTIKPKIDIITGNPIKVVVTDETALLSVEYSVDNNPVKTIYATETDDKKKIEFEIELESDDSEMTIVAYDTSNNKAIKSDVKVLKRPKIELAAESDYSKIYVTVTSELGLKKVQYDLNGQIFAQEFDNPEGQTEFKFYIPTVEGENKIKVSAYTTNDDVFAETEGTCTYNP